MRKPKYKPEKPAPVRPHHAAINRKRQEDKIKQENYVSCVKKEIISYFFSYPFDNLSQCSYHSTSIAFIRLQIDIGLQINDIFLTPS